ncbi:beta-glucosidase [Thermotoga neapolitana]|nr:beta-glucosidase [Thermotoga neapolitana]2X40_A Chain A, BETA-GLUCOSIDASE [Thermotoga neapolitana DSM 4359]2X41_A Chain A, BETA-GLUCOSIDASE [Thermotoga neapolitana DSM 4359]ABI29899.1 beta-glucosidase [Thermotoga neapolitana DSM 4359]KFZ22098.1 Beta-glucosidase [Thermotoga neapolitana LA10]HBF10520.1 glycosyl hydrolase [Thermotoga neapolitana]
MEKVNEILSQLTLEEKVKLVVGVGLPGLFGNPHSRVAGAAGETHPVPRVGLPAFVLADGPAGLRINPTRENDENTYYTTAFPVEIMLASTWNRELLEEVGKAMGEEVREYGVDVLLAPAMNIHRNPLCGRNFEYYSEDPVLSGEMASSFVKGVQSQGVGACIKHFVANNQETNRMVVDTIVSERALREIYLRGFEIAVKKSKPWSVMSAYNKLNGKYCSQNEWLLKKVLREEWGFEGFVMSDWYAGDNPVEQLKAGNDLIMPGKAYQVNTERRDEIEEIMEALKEGKLSEEVLDECVRNILKVLVNAPSFKNYRYSNKPDLEKHAKVAYEAGAEGVVLLRNEEALPLSENSKIALFGTGQIETIKGGTGSGDTHPRYAISILEGIKERGLNFDEELAKTYEDYIKKMRETEEYKPRRDSWGTIIKPKLPENFLSEKEIHKLAKKNDVAVIVISRISGEGYDRKPVKGDFYLSDDETDLIKTVSREFHEQGKKVIVLLNIGSPVEVVSWRDLVDGILLVWQAGQETGRIVADVLTGRINPSGKLPTTFPRDYSDVPSWTFPGEPKDNPQKVVYEEDIYVGYRYYDTFGVEPAYEFGYGLSYTTFEYSDLNVSFDGETLRVQYRIENTGGRAGKEVSQVYIKAPKGKIDKPFQELKAFHKTRLLNPGESEEVVLEIPVRDLASFNGEEWVVEAGEYEVRVGASSRNIKLKGTFSVGEERRFKP